jgi:hypothetical protein
MPKDRVAKKPVRVVNLLSLKGGVGKTSIGLSIAKEAASWTDGDGPVFIDLDLFGTDVLGLQLDTPDLEGLGMIELLTGSVGANTYFGQRIGDLKRSAYPKLILGKDASGESVEVTVIPTVGLRSLSRFSMGRSAGIDRQLMLVDFASHQVARRLLTLLDHVTQMWNPSAIIIDNSPMLAGISRLTRDLPRRAPPGHQRLYSKLFECEDVPPEESVLSWCNVFVVGNDPQDLPAYLKSDGKGGYSSEEGEDGCYQYADQYRAGKRDGSGFVLNKDFIAEGTVFNRRGLNEGATKGVDTNQYSGIVRVFIDKGASGKGKLSSAVHIKQADVLGMGGLASLRFKETGAGQEATQVSYAKVALRGGVTKEQTDEEMMDGRETRSLAEIAQDSLAIRIESLIPLKCSGNPSEGQVEFKKVGDRPWMKWLEEIEPQAPCS